MNTLPFPPEYLFLGIVLLVAIIVVVLHVLKSKKEYEAFQSQSQNEKPVMYMFYTEWCGHSQKMLPEWETFTENRIVKDKVEFKQVNCEKDDTTKKLCRDFSIKFLPTIIFIKNDGEKVMYNEGPDANELLEFTKKQLLPLTQ